MNQAIAVVNVLYSASPSCMVNCKKNVILSGFSSILLNQILFEIGRNSLGFRGALFIIEASNSARLRAFFIVLIV